MTCHNKWLEWRTDCMKKVIGAASEKIASIIEKMDAKLSHQKIQFWDIINLLVIFLFVWFAVSYIDIITHNTPETLGYENYAGWNLIQIIFK